MDTIRKYHGTQHRIFQIQN